MIRWAIVTIQFFRMRARLVSSRDLVPYYFSMVSRPPSFMSPIIVSTLSSRVNLLNLKNEQVFVVLKLNS